MTQSQNVTHYRRLPRLKLHLPIVSKSTKTEEVESVENFTPDGFFLKTSTEFSTGEILERDILFPGSLKNIKAKLEVVSRFKNNITGVGTKIVEISDEDILILERVYLETLGTTFSHHFAPLLNKNSYRPLFPFIDKKITYKFLEKLFAKNIKITLISENVSWITEGLFPHMAGNSISMFFTDTEIVIKSSHNEWIRVFIESNREYFYFHSNIKEITPNKMTISIPEKVFSQGRRRHYRVIQDPDWMMTVDIPLPYPPGARMRREIIDISTNGLSFKLDIKDNYLLPGTPLTNISIYRRDEKIMQTQAEVRHLTPFKEKNGKENLKVGIQFKIRSKRFSKGYMSTLIPEKLTSPQKVKDSEELNLIDLSKLGIQKAAFTCRWESRKISFKNKRNEEISAILDWTCAQGKSMPVVIISPALGKRKESTCLLASTILHNFRLYGHNVAIIRYDGIRNIGESYNDFQCREPGKEMLQMTLSQYVEDILSTLDYCYHNDLFKPDKVILTTPSISAVAARRALAIDDKKRTHFWLCPMGVSHLRRALLSISGGIDYLNIMNLGRKAGIASVLGCSIDWDNFWQDAQRHKFVSGEDGKKDLESLDIPIVWFRGLYDAWISPDDINCLLKNYPKSKISTVDIPTGHLPLNGQEAVKLFSLIVSHIWNFLFNQKITIFTPDRQMIESCLLEEWSQANLASTRTPEKYWSVRLIEKMTEYTDDGILSLSKDYRELMEHECSLIELQDGQSLVDIGCTNNGLIRLINKTYIHTTWHPFIIKMKKDSAYIKKTLSGAGYSYLSPSGIDIHHLTCNIDFHSLLIIRQFCKGEFVTFDGFKGSIKGLTHYSIELWKKDSSELLYAVLKGKKVKEVDRKALLRRFPEQEVELILEINKAARYVIENMDSFYDFHEPYNTEMLKTNILTFNQGLYNLPFKSDFFERILCTLALSYTRNFFGMLKEFYRILKKGGKIVFSLLKPDSALSVLYVDMISHISQDSPENLLGNFNNDKLYDYVKETGNVMVFLSHLFGRLPLHYFDELTIKELCYCLDFEDIEISESYGNPAKALIIKAVK